MSREEQVFYAQERQKAMQMLEQVPDQRLIYVLDYLAGALIPENADSFERQREWASLNGYVPEAAECGLRDEQDLE